jgi:hypothetical protein
MTDPILAKLARMIEHRADVARRWFGIKDKAATLQFIDDDPDVWTYLAANPQVEKALFKYSMMRVIGEINNGVNIAEHRARLGDEIVDRILATGAKLRGDQ